MTRIDRCVAVIDRGADRADDARGRGRRASARRVAVRPASYARVVRARRTRRRRTRASFARSNARARARVASRAATMSRASEVDDAEDARGEDSPSTSASASRTATGEASIDEAFAALRFSAGAGGPATKPARSFRRGASGTAVPRAARAHAHAFGTSTTTFSGSIPVDSASAETNEPVREPPVFQFSAIPAKVSPSAVKRAEKREETERPRARRDLNAQFTKDVPAAEEAATTETTATAPTAGVTVESPVEPMEIPSPEPASPEPMTVETPAAPDSNASSNFQFTATPTTFNMGQTGKNTSSGGSKKSAAFTRRASVRVQTPVRGTVDTPDSTTSAASSFGPASPQSPVFETPVPKQFTFSAPPKSPSKTPIPSTFNIGKDDSPSLTKQSRSFKFAQRAVSKGEKKASSSATIPEAVLTIDELLEMGDNSHLSKHQKRDLAERLAKMYTDVPKMYRPPRHTSYEADIDPIALKEQGNDAYLGGNWKHAEELYSRAILYYATAPRTNVAPASGEASPLGVGIDAFVGREAATLLTNRAAAIMSPFSLSSGRTTTIKAADYNEAHLRALTDCERAMKADETWTRARCRAALCNLHLGNFQAAIELADLSTCLPDTDSAKMLHKIRERSKTCVKHMEVIYSLLPALRSCAPGFPRLYTDEHSTPVDSQCMPWVLSVEAITEALPTFYLTDGVGEIMNEAQAWTLISIGSYHEAHRWAVDMMAIMQPEKTPAWFAKFRFMADFGYGQLSNACNQARMLPSDTVDEDFQVLINTAAEMVRHKDEGNKLFNAKNYTAAIAAYTSAFEASTSALGAVYCSTVLGNRAAANQGLNEVFDALADCGRALAFNPWNVKALSRRSTIHEQLRCWDEAVQDMQRYVDLLTNKKEIVTKAELEVALPAGMKRLRNLKAQAGLSTRPQVDAYAVLGLGKLRSAASASDIKKAYRTLALKYHPDKANRKMPTWAPADALHEDADRLFKLLSEMNGQLSDPALRRVYDETERLRQHQRSSPFTRANAWSSDDFQYGAQNFYPDVFTTPRRASRSRPYNSNSSANNFYWNF